MKILLLMLLIAAVCLWSSPAACWHCVPKRCSFDLDCGIGCFCYKGEYELNGVCVTE